MELCGWCTRRVMRVVRVIWNTFQGVEDRRTLEPAGRCGQLLVDTQQDHELGQNTYCISLASGATHYGGVRACALHGNRLTLRLCPKSAEELGIDEHVVVEFRVDPDATAVVRDGLLKETQAHRWGSCYPAGERSCPTRARESTVVCPR